MKWDRNRGRQVKINIWSFRFPRPYQPGFKPEGGLGLFLMVQITSKSVCCPHHRLSEEHLKVCPELRWRLYPIFLYRNMPQSCSNDYAQLLLQGA
jgi:hypothetical protein